MNSRELHAAELLSDYSAVIAALMSDGWAATDAEALMARLTVKTPTGRAPYRTWTRRQREELLAEAGPDLTLPSQARIRQLAEKYERTPKATQSVIERLIRNEKEARTRS